MTKLTKLPQELEDKFPEELQKVREFYFSLPEEEREKIGKKEPVQSYSYEPDFEDPIIDGLIDEDKWQIYNETITRLANDSNITFVTPNQVWKMRHPTCIQTGVPETFCNNVDDDCDMEIDEDYVPIQTTCGEGACQSNGTLECVGYEFDSCEPIC